MLARVRRLTRNLRKAFALARRNETDLAESNRELQAIRSSLEQRVNIRTRSLQAVSDISGAISAVLNLDVLLPRVVGLVGERFDLYYVGLFLIDEEERFAVLAVGTGEAGQQMLAQGHRLAVGGYSMIGQCVARDEPRVALDVGEEAVRFDNPLLPETRSELALPMHSRGRIIGAMTVQSVESAAFDEAYIGVLQSMADQVGVAIDNARLFAEARAALRDIEVTQRRYVAQSWSAYHRTAEPVYYETGHPTDGKVSEAEASRIRQAVERGAPVMSSAQNGEQQELAVVVPVTFRGQVLGVVGLHDDTGARRWMEEDLALVEAVVERLGIAADSLRLLEQTQRREARERLTREISARVQAAVELEEIVQVAAQELGRELDAAEVVLRLGTESQLIASAIENAHLHTATEQGLARADRATQTSWKRMVDAGWAPWGYRYTPAASGPDDGAWLSPMSDAVRSREPVLVTDDEEQAVLAAPLVLGTGVVTGAIGLRRAGSGRWDEESIALVRAVSEQVAQTLETRRLFHELSWRAQRESILRQTSEKIRTQANLDGVLQTAMREMQRITGATQVAIRLGTETQLGAADDQGTQGGRDE